MRCVSLLFVSALLGCPARTVAPKLPVSALASLTTEAERSGYVRTGRYDETLRLCEAFARVDGVFCDRVGTTGEDRPIVAVRIARQPNLPVSLSGGRPSLLGLVAVGGPCLAQDRRFVSATGRPSPGGSGGAPHAFPVHVRLLTGHRLHTVDPSAQQSRRQRDQPP